MNLITTIIVVMTNDSSHLFQ